MIAVIVAILIPLVTVAVYAVKREPGTPNPFVGLAWVGVALVLFAACAFAMTVVVMR